ncbi:ribbon-helix-helix protein, CopG family [Rodentibacter rarus]|uniref:ribbon-helix-helix protein, CopG family n=1 Tax=Rodentibacter rarus TaxID=1908260 RepID=UPI000985ED13|nr:ribbon-helix-helix protein, CopG family [Rodentibacter rarus]OOF37683.1 ribbon-helix-helix protein, CopG family [Rodentibacter rarus]
MGRPKSGLTLQELQAKSDKKRGVRLQSYKLHEEVIALLAELSEQTGLSKTQIVTQGILLFAETKKAA